MSAKPARKFSLADVQLTIGGYTISGGSESDFVSIERKEVGTYVTDASGMSTFNQNTDYSAEVTISVMPTSPAYRDLAAILTAQYDATISGAALPAVDFNLYDPLTGTYVRDRQCAVLEAPGVAFGKEVASVDWKLLLPNAFRPLNHAYGPSIT